MSFAFNNAKKKIQDGTLDLSADTIKVMLVTNSYIPTKDDDAVDLGGATGLAAAEISVTGYTGGYGGSGRKTLANKTFTADDTNDRAVFDNTADLVWSTLGSGTSIYAAVVIKEVATDDTQTIPIFYLELSSPISTNGQDFTLAFNAAGIHYDQN